MPFAEKDKRDGLKGTVEDAVEDRDMETDDRYNGLCVEECGAWSDGSNPFFDGDQAIRTGKEPYKWPAQRCTKSTPKHMEAIGL